MYRFDFLFLHKCVYILLTKKKKQTKERNSITTLPTTFRALRMLIDMVKILNK